MKILNKWKNWKPQWYTYIDRYAFTETKSIGYKWVRYRTSPYDRFTRMRRKDWDKYVIRTALEEQYRALIIGAFQELGHGGEKYGEFYYLKKARINKSHPTRRFGYEFKTFEEKEAEVLAVLDKPFNINRCKGFYVDGRRYCESYKKLYKLRKIGKSCYERLNRPIQIKTKKADVDYLETSFKGVAA